MKEGERKEGKEKKKREGGRRKMPAKNPPMAVSSALWLSNRYEVNSPTQQEASGDSPLLESENSHRFCIRVA